MGLKSIQELQDMIEELDRRMVKALETHRDGRQELEKRVKRLEDYVRTVQRTLAAKGIKAPTL